MFFSSPFGLRKSARAGSGAGRPDCNRRYPAFRPQLEALVGQLGLRDATHFTGFRQDARACQSFMNVCVFPSQNEPFGLVAVETLALGKPTIVFAHQRLDGSDRHCVKNAAEVRRALEASGRVLAVFQGHSHQNDYKQVGGIHYATLVAMVEGSGAENSGFAVADLSPDGTIRVRGFRRQAGYDWGR